MEKSLKIKAAVLLLAGLLWAEVGGYLKVHGFAFSWGNEKELVELLRFRLRVEESIGLFTVKLHYELDMQAGPSYFNSLLTGIYFDAFEPSTIYSDSSTSLYHYLDRASISYSGERLAFEVGRQRIVWGKARLFSPLDLFNPYNPFALEKEERQGVDALKVQLYFSGFSWIEGVYAKKKSGNVWGAALFTTLSNVDLNLAWARNEQDESFYGAALEASIFDAALRGEAVLRRWQGRNYFDFSLGVDYQFTSKIYALAEYFYTDGGWIFPEGKVLTLMTSIKVSDLTDLQVAWFRAEPGSGNFLMLRLVHSAAENLDVAFGLLYSSSGSSTWQLPKIAYSGYSLYF